MSFLMKTEELKNYLVILKPYTVYSFLIFSISVLIGAFSAVLNPNIVTVFLGMFAEIVEPIVAMENLEIFITIFALNSFTVFLAILFGFAFAIYPAFILVINGFIIGILLYASREAMDTFFLAILPHGIIEIPALFLGTAAGIMIGSLVFRNVFQKESNPIKKELVSGLRFFLTLIIPLLLLAAFIETWITPAILSLYLGIFF